MNGFIKRSLLSMAPCILVMGCAGSDADAMNKTIETRGQRYQIPAQYILPDLPSAMVPRGAGMDTDEGVILSIPLHDLGISPASDEAPAGFAEFVHILLYGPSAFTSANEYDLHLGAYEAWTGTGLYRNREIVRDDRARLYRVNWRKGGKSWEYFVESPPTSEQSATPRWVASCWLSGREEEAEDMSNVKCKTQVSITQGDADISFSGRYINQVDAIIEGVKKKIREWAVSG